MKDSKKSKVLFLSLSIIFLILTISIVPLNIFVVNIPRFVLFICAIFSLSSIVVYVLIFPTKKITKILLPLIYTLTLGFFCFVSVVIPYWDNYVLKPYKGNVLNYDDEVTSKEAKEDVAEVMDLLRRIHPLFLYEEPIEVSSAYKQVIKEIEEKDKITVNELRKYIQRVLYPIHDAHTSTYNSWVNDKFLLDALNFIKDGYTFHSLNNMDRASLNLLIEPYTSYDSLDSISFNKISLALLDFVSIKPPYVYEWEKEGIIERREYTKESFVSAKEYNEYAKKVMPHSSSKNDKPFVFYDIDEEKSLAVLTIKECIYNDFYKECVNSMFKEVASKGIENIAVDVRGNYGGSSLICNEFIKYLPIKEYKDCSNEQRFNFFMVRKNPVIKNKQYQDLIFNGNVYVLTDKDTFSSSMMFGQLIQDNDLGYVVGQASGNNANGYGDITGFRLKNSKIFIQVSTKKWYRIDRDNPSSYIIPDYQCEGKDALDKVYSILQG